VVVVVVCHFIGTSSSACYHHCSIREETTGYDGGIKDNQSRECYRGKTIGRKEPNP